MECSICGRPTIGDNLICDECKDGDFGDDERCEEHDDDYDPLEDEFANCHCGAYCISKTTGNIIKVSDCIC